MKLINRIAFLLALMSVIMEILQFSSFRSFGENALAENSKYQVEFDSDMPSMGLSAFENKEKKVLLERIGENYYLTVSLNSDVVSDFKILGSTMKVGETVFKNGNIERHRFTVTEKEINSTFRFSLKVTAMDRIVEFSLTPKLDTAIRLGDIDDLSERPALFVPEMEVNEGSTEVEKGSTYVIPEWKASLGEELLEVKVQGFYMENGKKTEVEIKERKLFFSKVGEYRLVFRAESEKYKTSKGNNTFVEKEMVFKSKIGAGTLVKFEDPNGVLPEGSQIQANILENGKTYEQVEKLMENYSENFEVFEVTLYDEEGKALSLDGKIKLSFRANDLFDRKEMKVFFLTKEGTFKEYTKENFGRYVRIDAENTGTYVLLVEGISFKMPIWGYALIFGAVILSAGGIITAVVIVAKRKKKNV